MKAAFVVAALAAVSSSAFAQNQKDPNWGVSVGYYIPTSGEIRDQFGDALLRYGISPISNKYSKNWAVTPDVSILSASRDGSRAFVLPLSLNLTKGFDQGNGTKTFVSFGAGPAYFDYRLYRTVGLNVVEYKDKTVGWNANVEFGLLVNRRLSIEARYDVFEEQDGFDLSGWSISANYALFRW